MSEHYDVDMPPRKFCDGVVKFQFKILSRRTTFRDEGILINNHFIYIYIYICIHTYLFVRMYVYMYIL